MTTTPSRSPLGAFVRSPLGVRGGGKIELYNGAGGRSISCVGGGYSLGNVSPINNSTNLCANFVKSASNMSRSIVSAKGRNSRWYSTAVRAAYLNGVWAVFGYKTNNSGSAFEIYTSTDRKDWTLKISVAGSYGYLYEGFSATPSGFYGWFKSTSSSTGWYSVSSSDGSIWSQSEVAQNRWRVYNPMLQSITSNGLNEPWVYGYDQPNGIMVGIGGATSSTFFGITTYSRAEDPKIYTTANGTSWSLVHTHTSNLIFCAAGGGQMAAGNFTSLLYSPDMGVNWSEASAGNVTSMQPLSADYLGSSFVIHGEFTATDSAGSFQTAVAILKDGVLSAKRPNSIVSAIA
jgi:hypothetical protein